MSVVDKLFEDCESLVRAAECPETLWHYTRADSLIDILESRSLRLSCYRFMNDPSEGRVSPDLIVHSWTQALARIESHSRFDVQFLRKQNWLPALDYAGTSSQSTFVFSASRLEDSLSQWARYAADGGGVALGFTVDSKALAAWNPGSGWRYGPYLSKVFYWSPPTTNCVGSPEGDGATNELIASLSDRLERFLSEAHELTEIYNGLLLVAEALAPSIKAAPYHEEKELRIVALTSADATNLYEVKPNRFGFAPVMHIPLSNAGIRLTKLKIGPKLGSDGIWSATWLKAKYGLDVEVTESTLRYR